MAAGFPRSRSAPDGKNLFWLVCFVLLSLTSAVPITVAADSCAKSFSKLLEGAPASLPDFFAKLERAADSLNPEENFAFLAEPKPGKKLTLVGQIKGVGQYLTEEDLSLAKAAQAPQPLTLGDSPGHHRGGLAVWKGDIFPIDFFFKNQARFGSDGSEKLLAKVAQQPYFSWNAERSVYEFQRSGADSRILSLVANQAKDSTSIPLYRGTTNYEDVLLRTYQSVAKGTIPSDWKSKLKSGLDEITAYCRKDVKSYEESFKDGYVTAEEVAKKKEALSAAIRFSEERMRAAEGLTDPAKLSAYLRDSLERLVSESKFAGLFVTPNPARAAEFSKGRVVEFRVSLDELKRLQSNGQMFVGLEKIGDKPEVEMSFLARGKGEESSVLDLILRSFRDSRAVKASNIFN